MYSYSGNLESLVLGTHLVAIVNSQACKEMRDNADIMFLIDADRKMKPTEEEIAIVDKLQEKLMVAVNPTEGYEFGFRGRQSLFHLIHFAVTALIVKINPGEEILHQRLYRSTKEFTTDEYSKELLLKYKEEKKLNRV